MINATPLAQPKAARFKGLSMVLLGAVLWGVSSTAAQVLFQRYAFAPGWLVAVRMSVAGLLLLAATAATSGLMPTLAVWTNRGDALRLVVFGIVGLLGVQYSYFAAIRYGNAATATMLQYTGPVFLVLYVALRRRRLPTATQLVAMLLALVGVFLLVTDGRLHALSVSPLAVAWGLISAITLAFYTLYPQSLLQQYGAATIVGWGMFVGGVCAALAVRPWQLAAQPTRAAWGLVGFVVLFGTLVAFYAYIASLKYISATEASLLACAEPLSAAIIAVAVLHVSMGPAAMLGGLCVVVTVTVLARAG